MCRFTKAGINRRTINYVWNKYKKTGSTNNTQRSGRPPKLTKRDIRSLTISVRRQPFAPYYVHQQNLASAGIDVCRNTVIKYLKQERFLSRSPARKPRLTATHMVRRRLWARLHRDWTLDKWSNVMWSDESRFTVVGNDGGARVIRRDGERYQPCHVITTQKFGKGSVMVWGCF